MQKREQRKLINILKLGIIGGGETDYTEKLYESQKSGLYKCFIS